MPDVALHHAAPTRDAPPAPRPVLTLAARAQLDLLFQLGAIGPDLGVTSQNAAGVRPMLAGSLVRKGLAAKRHLPRTDCQPQRTEYWLTPAGLRLAEEREARGGPPLTRNQLAALAALERLELRGDGPATAATWRAEVEAGPWRCTFQPDALERRGLVARLAATLAEHAPAAFELTARGREALRRAA